MISNGSFGIPSAHPDSRLISDSQNRYNEIRRVGIYNKIELRGRAVVHLF
jgi:hypothetical protein